MPAPQVPAEGGQRPRLASTLVLGWLVVASVAWVFDDTVLGREGALLPSLVLRRPQHAYRLLMHAFVPNGHLADPVFALAAAWAFGPPLEAQLGSRRFLWLLGLSALLSGLAAMVYGSLHPSFRAQPAHGVGTLGFALTAAFAASLGHDARLRLPGLGPIRARPFLAILLALGLSSVLLGSQEASPAAPLCAVPLGALLLSWLMPRKVER